MGKKNKKTRWRALTLNGHESDSEESSTPSSILHQNHRHYHNRYYNSKLTYSSQSTPIRKYQNESSKTTRSNSTTSEHKTTFNEDEYTRITTPRQDVLFKKGYLNKPKNYQTQTSTGASSTANSTSTCTPDHQSADGTEGTDLEYESQFVFPNGFIDQNGIYYINSYEPFPFVVYNAPICYPEYPIERTKRYSTDSAGPGGASSGEVNFHSSSMTPDQTAPRDSVISGGGASLSLKSGVDAASAEASSSRRSSTTMNGETDSVSPQNEELVQNGVAQPVDYYYNNASASDNSNEEPRRIKKKRRRKISRTKEDGNTSCDSDSSDVIAATESPQISSIENHSQETPESNHTVESEESKSDNDSPNLVSQSVQVRPDDEETHNKHHLKPDAEEFIPRTFQVPAEVSFQHNNIQFVNYTPSFIPVPYLNHSPTFLPPGIPINYIPIQDPKYANVIVPSATEITEPPAPVEKVPEVATQTEVVPEKIPVKKSPIDIAKIVSKLEEAVEEQNKRENPVVNQVKRNRYQYQRNYRGKLLENPKIQQSAQNSVNNRLGNSTNCSKLNNYSGTVKKMVVNKTCAKYEKAIIEPVAKQPKSPNQWISVSSRKKKKKSANEQQGEFEETVDKEEEKVQSDDLFESFDVNLLEDVVPPSKTTSDSDIKQEDLLAEQNNVEDLEIKPDVETTGTKTNDIVTKTAIDTIAKNKEPKKKSKRVTQKPPVKRVIITDHLQEETFIEDVKNVKPDGIKMEPKPLQCEPETKPTENNSTELLDKKKKKKKKVAKIQSISSSTTTLRNLDDSYDFLLETSIMEDCDQKTNIEMSQAFDLMIQKGMYNSLEEKIKALNIGASDDGFFKRINFVTFKTPPTPSKQIVAPPHFTTLFEKDFLNSETEPSKPNIFLENPTVNEIIKNVVDSSSVHIEPIGTSAPHQEDDAHPITQAVKNWLTKTRENTPDVELLKSPNTIYKELCESPEKNEDEVTLWSVSPINIHEEDLIDCWENDLPVVKEPVPVEEINGYNGQIEEGEEVIEIYESHYGKNEDYLKLKSEVEDQQKAARNFPRHGNLPYRAICCNIM